VPLPTKVLGGTVRSLSTEMDFANGLLVLVDIFA
jgi:hypothetical protein